MEDKYFTPDIEDLKVGYECELDYYTVTATSHNQGWRNYIINRDVDFQTMFKAIDSKKIRTPHLTKEQIEAEGWKETSKCNYEKIDSNITSYYGNDHYLWIMHPATTVLGEKYLANSFKGECKSINEFRYICKLLKI